VTWPTVTQKEAVTVAAALVLTHPDVGAQLPLLQKVVAVVILPQIPGVPLRHFLQKVEWAGKYKCQNFSNTIQ
jgi:hypothetical protein